MAGNGTPQSYLNGIIQRNNNGQIRDRAMEQDNTNSGNPYGYIPQLPDQQVPSSYPSNRYIPPTMTGVNGSWNNTGLTYSLPTAYNPYGQGGTPYGPQMPTPWMPTFYNKSSQQQQGPAQGPTDQGSAGAQAAPPAGVPQQAAGVNKPGVAGATYQQAPTQVPSNSGTTSPQANPNRGQWRDRYRPQAGDFYRGSMPVFRKQANQVSFQPRPLPGTSAQQNLNSAIQSMANYASNNPAGSAVVGDPQGLSGYMNFMKNIYNDAQPVDPWAQMQVPVSQQDSNQFSNNPLPIFS